MADMRSSEKLPLTQPFLIQLLPFASWLRTHCAASFAMSHLAHKPAELLWKSGNADTPEWEHALLTDKKTLRVWMGPTQPPGDAYYRLIGYADKMRKMADTEIAYEQFSYNSNDQCSEWQQKMLMNEDGEPVSSLAIDQFEKCLKVADPWVFQVTYLEEVLSLFELLKTVYPNKKLITECDDWIFDLPAYNVASNPYKPGSDKERIADEQFKWFYWLGPILGPLGTALLPHKLPRVLLIDEIDKSDVDLPNDLLNRRVAQLLEQHPVHELVRGQRGQRQSGQRNRHRQRYR